MDFSNLQNYIGGVILFIISLIKIPKLELNVWGWLMQMFSKSINKETMKEFESLKVDIKNLKDDVSDLKENLIELDNKMTESNRRDEEERAKTARQNILVFDDELLFHSDIRHTKERFDNVLEQIDYYEQYCKDHEEFKNNKAMFAIKHIKSTYDYCMSKRTFLEQHNGEK